MQVVVRHDNVQQCRYAAIYKNDVQQQPTTNHNTSQKSQATIFRIIKQKRQNLVWVVIQR
jgi:hypothetical protein